MKTTLPASFLGILALLLISGERAVTQDYAAQVEAWRVDREENLKADDGWLTVAGLFFLNEGENSFGSSPLNDIVLRTGPAQAGVFTLLAGAVTARAPAGETLSVNGRDVAAARIWPREGDVRQVVEIGPLTLFVHYSGPRLAIRLRDRDSELRRSFTGLRWFPVDESYRVRGRYVPHGEPRTVELSNILGDIEPARSSGSVVLTVGGEGAAHDRNRPGRPAVVHLPRPDQRTRDLPRRPLPLRRPPVRRRLHDGRLQPRLQPAVRVQPIHDLPSTAAREPPASENRGRRTRLLACMSDHVARRNP